MKEVDELKKQKSYIKRYGIYAYIRKYGTKHVFSPNADLFGVVIELERLRRQGFKYFYSIYEGHYLYSLDETFDSACRKVYGMSRKSYLEKLRKDKLWAEAVKAMNNQEKNNSRKLKIN